MPHTPRHGGVILRGTRQQQKSGSRATFHIVLPGELVPADHPDSAVFQEGRGAPSFAGSLALQIEGSSVRSIYRRTDRRLSVLPIADGDMTIPALSFRGILLAGRDDAMWDRRGRK